jgi:hypothetical protein
MFTMVAEFAHPQTVATPQSQREQFRATLIPPPDWRVWIAPFDGRVWNKKFHHIGMGLFEFPEPNRVPPCNVQITTAAVGKLLFQSFRFDPDAAYFQLTSFYGYSLNIVPVWPAQDTPIGRPIKVLSDNDADYVAVALRKLLMDSFPPK